jgi:hypothetical protein
MRSNAYWAAVVAGVVVIGLGLAVWVQTPAEAQESGSERLAVVWSSGDPDVAHKVCLMYTHAAKKAGWFDDVELIVWGPSSRLLAADKDLQTKVRAMVSDGVVVRACVVCANIYGVAERLRELDVDVKPMGKPLSDRIKSGWRTLTF